LLNGERAQHQRFEVASAQLALACHGSDPWPADFTFAVRYTRRRRELAIDVTSKHKMMCPMLLGPFAGERGAHLARREGGH